MAETKFDRDVETIKGRTAIVPVPRLDPQALIDKAIVAGASIDTLERLVTLAKDVRQMTAREAFFEAKAEFQRRCPAIKKTKTARIPTRSGASFSYSYAPLEEIIAMVDPLLSELGFSKSWKQKPETNGVAANCILSHKMGHEEESGFITMPYGSDDGRMNGAQRVGSAMTYARRYSLLAILGLAPEDDDDAQGADVAGRGDTERASAKTTQAERKAPGVAEPQHAPGDLSAPMGDPDSPELKREAETLLPGPADDLRDKMVLDIKGTLAKLKQQKKVTDDDIATWKKTYLGSETANPFGCDPAAVSDLHSYLVGRFPDAGWKLKK
jgi:hypothetical protein